jgi:hypothetical protein
MCKTQPCTQDERQGKPDRLPSGIKAMIFGTFSSLFFLENKG